MDDLFGTPYSNRSIYFEKQRLCQCGIHALNNMIGRHVISYEHIDIGNEIGNYTIFELRDVFKRKTYKDLDEVCVVNRVYPQTHDESKTDYVIRLGGLLFEMMSKHVSPSFVCQRRSHFFAMRYDPSIKSMIMIDSTKETMFSFDVCNKGSLGRVLRNVTIHGT